MKLYLIYLGGQLAEGRMGEDHEVIAVVAEDQTAAKQRAKVQWKGVGAPHIDAVRCLDTVDGYQVTVAQLPETVPERPVIDDDWLALNAPVPSP